MRWHVSNYNHKNVSIEKKEQLLMVHGPILTQRYILLAPLYFSHNYSNKKNSKKTFINIKKYSIYKMGERL